MVARTFFAHEIVQCLKPFGAVVGLKFVELS